jgi:Tol biopolymer transport system component/DNA-binding winged helix-turn-helix (wHTH) protein
VPGDQHNGRVIQFGQFEADLQTQELRKQGRRLRLPRQSFQILKTLLERPGELITREELRTALWPVDTFVDFEHGLNASVNRLREAIGDSADRPRLVETLPRRGYRFIGAITPSNSVTASEDEAHEQRAPAIVEGNRAEGARPAWFRVGAWALAALACTLAVSVIYPKFRPRLEPLTLSADPFTAYEGTETMPALSPDGSQIAFTWDGDSPPGSKGFDLYVKVIGSESLLRLTRRPSTGWTGSAWSPDHTQIAFHRIAGSDTGVYVVPALGGPERKLRSTRMNHAIGTPLDWSPDGKWIAFQDALPPDNLSRLYLLSPETLESRQIPHAPECLAEGSPAFSHDGKHLAYTCVQNMEHRESRIYTVAISDGQLNPITTVGGTITGSWGPLMGLAWTADDKKLIFPGGLVSGGTGEIYELTELTLADGSLRGIRLGQSAIWPTMSKRGDKLAYATYSFQINIWQKDLLNPESPATKLISSTREQASPVHSPDGKHIAFVSTRGGIDEIWISDPDGTQPVQVSNFKASGVQGPSWSPDGKKIAFDTPQAGSIEVYVVDISERVSRKLKTNISTAMMPSWSHDGKWIYFISHGGKEVYRCPATGGDAVVIAGLPPTEWGLYPVESFDGETVYFTSVAGDGKSTLYAVSLRKLGTKVALEEIPTIDHAAFWTIVPGGIYFVPADAPKSIRYFDFRAKRVRQIFESDKRFWYGLSVSPDGRYILYSKVDEENQDIMLADKFR